MAMSPFDSWSINGNILTVTETIVSSKPDLPYLFNLRFKKADPPRHYNLNRFEGERDARKVSLTFWVPSFVSEKCQSIQEKGKNLPCSEYERSEIEKDFLFSHEVIAHEKNIIRWVFVGTYLRVPTKSKYFFLIFDTPVEFDNLPNLITIMHAIRFPNRFKTLDSVLEMNVWPQVYDEKSQKYIDLGPKERILTVNPKTRSVQNAAFSQLYRHPADLHPAPELQKWRKLPDLENNYLLALIRNKYEPLSYVYKLLDIAEKKDAKKMLKSMKEPYKRVVETIFYRLYFEDCNVRYTEYTRKFFESLYIISLYPKLQLHFGKFTDVPPSKPPTVGDVSVGVAPGQLRELYKAWRQGKSNPGASAVFDVEIDSLSQYTSLFFEWPANFVRERLLPAIRELDADKRVKYKKALNRWLDYQRALALTLNKYADTKLYQVNAVEVDPEDRAKRQKAIVGTPDLFKVTVAEADSENSVASKYTARD